MNTSILVVLIFSFLAVISQSHARHYRIGNDYGTYEKSERESEKKVQEPPMPRIKRTGHMGVTGPVHTYQKTNKEAHFKWGVKHHVGHHFAG